MRSAAIICEFNPLHNGHRYILSKMRESADAVICIMSGNFTQRSEAAIYDKYKRAECAIAAGANAVLSLPFPWSSASGEYFATAGVHIAESIGCEDLYFGVNTPFAELLPTVNFMRTADFSEKMRERARMPKYKGVGARTVFEDLLRENGLKLPGGENDVLALEYCRAAACINTIPLKRLPHGDGVSSASDIRELFWRGETEKATAVMPRESLDILAGIKPIDRGALAELERIYLRMFACKESFDELEAAFGGIGDRLINAARASCDGEEMLSLARSKKYTDSRSRRAALYALVGVKRGTVASRPQFTELLAADARGTEFLSNGRKTRTIELLTKPADYKKLSPIAAEQYEVTLRADEIYSYLRGEPCASYYIKRSPIIRKDPSEKSEN